MNDGALFCEKGHKFDVEEGIPLFARNPRREAVPSNMKACRYAEQDGLIDPFVNDWLVNTNGNLYWRARGRLRRYPFPNWPFEKGEGRVLVDVGCGWGRWTLAAAQAGFTSIGVDVHVDALAAGGRVSRQTGVRADYLCGDAENLPFQSGSIDVLFSYSVLQHLERSKVIRILAEVSRVLKPLGLCLVQLPNALGLCSVLRQVKRGFREAKLGTFEMRYWSRSAIRHAVEEAGMQLIAIRADGFFTQNPQISDLDLLSPVGKLIILASHAGCKVSEAVPILARVADSLWIEARTPPR